MFRTYVDVTPETLLAELLQAVIGVGPGKTLANKVRLAQAYYAAGDIQATCVALADFVSTVQQLSAGKKPRLSAAIAAELVADATEIMAAIGCK